jgi:hypothetical protein
VSLSKDGPGIIARAKWKKEYYKLSINILMVTCARLLERFKGDLLPSLSATPPENHGVGLKIEGC